MDNRIFYYLVVISHVCYIYNNLNVKEKPRIQNPISTHYVKYNLNILSYADVHRVATPPVPVQLLQGDSLRWHIAILL